MPSTKVTITVPGDILSAVDSYVREHPGVSRSSVCTKAIAAWLQAEQDALIESYYEDQSLAERQEDDQWRRLASQSAAATWE